MVEDRTQIETRVPATFTHTIENQVQGTFDPRHLPQSATSAFVQWRRVRTYSDSEEYRLVQMPAALKSRWYDWIVELFKDPDADKLAYREYEETRRMLLQCQRMRDYYENMLKFQNQRLQRLRKTLHIDEE